MVRGGELNPMQAMRDRYQLATSAACTDLTVLSGLRQDFVGDCLRAVAAKKSRLAGPLLGELFPHLVAEGLHVLDKDRRRLAAAWLALYGYICLVDFQLDRRGHLDARSVLASSALLGWGVATMAEFTSGTPYHGIFIANISAAFSGQYEDMQLRANCGANRQNSDTDKNRPIVAAVIAYCAASHGSSDYLIRASEILLHPLQVLDDFQDLEEDLSEGNMTVFANIVRAGFGGAAGGALFCDPYTVLLRDHKTLLQFEEAREAIGKAMMLLSHDTDRPLFSFLTYLYKELIAITSMLGEYQAEPNNVTEPEILGRIRGILCNC